MLLPFSPTLVGSGISIFPRTFQPSPVESAGQKKTVIREE
jgi:hypothetical protein